jgi:hypothetical protein
MAVVVAMVLPFTAPAFASATTSLPLPTPTPTPPATPADAEDPPPGYSIYKVDVDNAQFARAIFCLKTTTSMSWGPRGNMLPAEADPNTLVPTFIPKKTGDRWCSKDLAYSETQTLYILKYPGDDVFLDLESFVFDTSSSQTSDNNVITGAHQCTTSGGLTIVTGLTCDTPPPQAVAITPVTVAPYAMGTGASDPGMVLLNLLAWCVTAACVAGLMVTGLNLALQMRRGDPGEMSEHWRGFLYVGGACLLGMSAGPIIAFLNFPS